MKIVVLIKRVPDTAASIRIASDGKSIVQDIELVLSPYDEMAVEEAIQIKENNGAEVVAVLLGPSDAKPQLRLALEMGADRAIHLVDDEASLDMWGVAKELAAVVEEEKPDLVIGGRTAVDLDQSFVAPAVAAMLDMPYLSAATNLDVDESAATIRHEVEGGYEVLRASLPCVVTTQKGINEPRYPSLKSKIKAKRKKMDVREVGIRDAKVSLEKLEYPPKREGGRVLGEGTAGIEKLVDVLRDEVKLL
ncbi:MAG: electron transfer flavoprotein subunit beta/FixA family protein [Planctomycetota bacterium]|nr:electron transfer flavoprotein subunit beta/FixA family protein [Planctomycetota bacterium]